MENILLETKNLFYTYNPNSKFNLSNINCSIQSNKFTTIIGANGSGKTTLFRCLSGLLKPQDGNVFIFGKNIKDVSNSERSKRLAIIHQVNDLHANITVEEIVEMGRLPYSNSFGFDFSKKDREVINRVIKMVGIDDIRDKSYQRLSGGQQQRVWLALALSQEPEVILLDEPTNHLDVLYQLELLQLLKSMVNRGELTVCAILHDLNHVMRFSDNVIVMKDGEIIASGEVEKTLTEDVIYEAFKVKSKMFVGTQDNRKHKVLDFYIEEK